MSNDCTGKPWRAQVDSKMRKHRPLLSEQQMMYSLSSRWEGSHTTSTHELSFSTPKGRSSLKEELEAEARPLATYCDSSKSATTSRGRCRVLRGPAHRISYGVCLGQTRADRAPGAGCVGCWHLCLHRCPVSGSQPRHRYHIPVVGDAGPRLGVVSLQQASLLLLHPNG